MEMRKILRKKISKPPNILTENSKGKHKKDWLDDSENKKILESPNISKENLGKGKRK